MRSDLKKLDSFTLETSKNHLIRNFLRNGRLRFNRHFAILTSVSRYSKWPGVGPINPKEEKTGSSFISFETEFLMLILEAEKFQNKFKLK